MTGKDSDLRWSVTDVNNSKTSYNYDVLNRLTSASGPTESPWDWWRLHSLEKMELGSN